MPLQSDLSIAARLCEKLPKSHEMAHIFHFEHGFVVKSFSHFSESSQNSVKSTVWDPTPEKTCI